MTDVDVMNDDALNVLMRAAIDASAAYPWVSFDQFYQEAWIWRVRHPVLTEQLMEQDTLGRQMLSHLRLVAQRERAQQTGYHPDDVTYYTPAMIANLLPQSLDIQSTLAPSGATDDARGASDPHARSGFLCSLIDVCNAWIVAPFRRDEKQILRLRYIEDLNWGEIAATTGHDMEEVKKRAAQGLRRLVDVLGGWRGRSCPVDCVDCIERDIADEEVSSEAVTKSEGERDE